MSPIPRFFDEYHLPDGEYECTMKEIEERFLFSDTRKHVWALFTRLLDRILSFGLQPDVMLIDGSFVTGREKPEDVDFALLLRPEQLKTALSNVSNQHDQNAIYLLMNPKNQCAIRDLFGAHPIIVHDEKGLELISKIFRIGKNGQLRDPDPIRDPDWVKRPQSKGILKIQGGELNGYQGTC